MLGKQNVVYLCNGVLFGHKKEKVLIYATTLMNLKNIMAATKDHLFYDPMYMKCEE
jgi:hypothetical protein